MRVTVPVLFQEEIVKGIRLFPALVPAERLAERTVEQIVDVPVPQILEEVVQVVKAGSAVPSCPSGANSREDL